MPIPYPNVTGCHIYGCTKILLIKKENSKKVTYGENLEDVNTTEVYFFVLAVCRQRDRNVTKVL